MDWFFEQVLYGTQTCDFEVASISNSRVINEVGFLEGTEDCLADDKGEVKYHSVARLVQNGDMQIPVDIRITFEDGSVSNEYWDGQSRIKEIDFVGGQRIASVVVDPDHCIVLDMNFINNSRTVEPQSQAVNSYTVRWLSSIQRFMETLSLLV